MHFMTSAYPSDQYEAECMEGLGHEAGLCAYGPSVKRPGRVMVYGRPEAMSSSSPLRFHLSTPAKCSSSNVLASWIDKSYCSGVHSAWPGPHNRNWLSGDVQKVRQPDASMTALGAQESQAGIGRIEDRMLISSAHCRTHTVLEKHSSL